MRWPDLQQRLQNLRQSARDDAGLTPRAWIFMLILVCAICYWVFLAEMVYFAADLVSSSLMVGAVFPLCLLLLLNALLSSRRQRSLVAFAFAAAVSAVAANAGTALPIPAAIVIGLLLTRYFLKAWKRCQKGRAWEPLTRRELLLIYIAITVSTWFSSMGGVEFLASAMTSPFYFANSSNGWGDLAPLIPRWISVRNPAALNPFFNGQASWLRPAFLHAWAIPILAWSLFAICFFGFALAVNSLLSKQWIEHERLTFPIAQFPLQLTQEGQQPALWRSPLFWLGAIIAFSVEAVNGIHMIVPTVPTIPILPTDLGGFLNQAPWSGAGGLKVAFYPWILGLVYLVPLDVSFSSWFFYLFARLEGVAAVALGVRAPGAADTGAPPYQMDQGFGAFIGLSLITLW
ncbi:MAG TPA: DUF6785 family protein, partial [Armatimonadota bacterium]|nr:DUF6785 family protein [Armatimonadota bacterium]